MASYDLSIIDSEAPLFADQHPHLLVFSAIDEMSGYDVVDLLGAIKPSVVIDLRIAPRFDLQGLSRRQVFEEFDRLRIKYIDLPALVKRSGSEYDPVSSPDVAGHIRKLALRGPKRAPGPIMLFCEPEHSDVDTVESIAQQLDADTPIGWETIRVPEYGNTNRIVSQKSMIFLSHATPEDSDFARWLSSQLVLSGYEVWVDLNRLIGGEPFWDEIEDAIRNRAARFIVAISRKGQKKQGLLDEINLAVTLERARGDEGFVIPVRLDDLPFFEMRANIARKNVIDFSENWADGLLRILSLLERERVPKGSSRDGAELLNSLMRRELAPEKIRALPEQILLNWLLVKKLPSSVHAYSFSAPSSRLAALSRTLPFPNVAVGDSVVCCVPPSDMASLIPSGVGSKVVGGQTVDEFLDAREPLNSHLPVREHRKVFSSLLRQSWNASANSRGLHPYELASGAIAWFAPLGIVPDNKVQYRDAGGVPRRKTLVGFSAKRNVYWHFALELKLLPGLPHRFSAKPHVIFSVDGLSPLDSSSKMHALRRGFCKTWWNDRWRDLTIAMLHWLSGPDDFPLFFGGTAQGTMSGSLLPIISPFSPVLDGYAKGSAGLDGDQCGDEVEDVDLDDEEEGFIPEAYRRDHDILEK